MASVKVAVRVRPLNKREKQFSPSVGIHVKGNVLSIHKPSTIRGDPLKDKRKTFSFDFSYDSTDRGSPTFASQERIFHDLGSDVLKAAFEGFNACVFAYGQTGSGKSYTMMGHEEDVGLIPRICEGFFQEISLRRKGDTVSFHTEVSFLEIYNERVQDLLKKRTICTDGGSLRVREHPRDGPYVENLSKHLVHNHSEIKDLLILGNTNRTTARTRMNDSSSRSHAIFTISFTQAWFDTELPHETQSKIHLVDLAGSERADATCTTGTRLKEGANINKSLVTLGSVISALAVLSVGGLSTKKQIFIPYRDSVLTWLLKDSLGGNSLTTMIATVSPADVNYEETLSTLRYASRAKNIVNSPMVNENGRVKVIRELQAEVTRLRKLLEEANQVSNSGLSSSVTVEQELHQNKAKVLALTKEWTSKWGETQSILQAKDDKWESCMEYCTDIRGGVFFQFSTGNHIQLHFDKSKPKRALKHNEETVALRKEGSGVVLDCQLPHLVGLDEDLLSTGITLYNLKEGRTLIGSDEPSGSQDIVLHGPGLLGEHCVLENRAGTVTLIPQDGALCSVNGSVVTKPSQLTQGAIIQLGKGTILRFNHPTEAAQLKEKRQSELLPDLRLPLTDASKSTESLSMVMLQNPGLMDMLATEMVESKVLSSPLSPAATERLMTAAIPGKSPVPETGFELDGNALQGGVSTRDGQEQKRDSCHKSEPGLMSERPRRKSQSGAGIASYKTEEVWSWDTRLQQTSVLGLGDGCDTKPEGNANEIQGVVADCYKGRPGSSGSSLDSVSHLQSHGGTSSTSILPQTSTHFELDRKALNIQAACHPPEENAIKGQSSYGEMAESEGLEEILGVTVTRAAAAKVQNSGLGSLVSTFSWIVQDAGRLLWHSPTVLQHVREEGLQPVGSRLSSHVISLVRDSNVLSVVKDSQVFSMVKGSFVFSLLKDSHIFSMVKELPLIQHIQMEITQLLEPEETAQIIQGCTQLPILTPIKTFNKAEELQDDIVQVPEKKWTMNKSIEDQQLPQEQDLADIHLKQGDKQTAVLMPVKHTIDPPEDKHEAHNNSWMVQNTEEVKIFSQTLIEFPDFLSNLQTLPMSKMMDVLQSIISTSVLNSQRIVACYWLSVAKCSQPKPCPALLILMETGLYALTTVSGLLVLFHHLPFLQLKEVQIGLAGHSLRLMGTTEESILGVYTHSQMLTKELCWTMLSVICPGESRLSQHPLLHGDLLKMSLDWQACVPDLLLDAGLKVCCQFQKSLADLVYLLHCSIDQSQDSIHLGEVQILLYTSVGVCINPSTCTEHLAQLFLTDTHLALLQEDVVFHPTPHSVTTPPCCPQFRDFTLRQRSDIRCVLVHDEDERGAVRLDVILANVKGRGHPEGVTKTATMPAHASNSSLHAEVWKLTFSCSTEAACLINHLSNV